MCWGPGYQAGTLLRTPWLLMQVISSLPMLHASYLAAAIYMLSSITHGWKGVERSPGIHIVWSPVCQHQPCVRKQCIIQMNKEGWLYYVPGMSHQCHCSWGNTTRNKRCSHTYSTYCRPFRRWHEGARRCTLRRFRCDRALSPTRLSR